jgi:prolipoprotein diacylglyceryltransferase
MSPIYILAHIIVCAVAVSVLTGIIYMMITDEECRIQILAFMAMCIIVISIGLVAHYWANHNNKSKIEQVQVEKQ